ncbi:MAG: phytoene/squalene synthase family protein [Cytophagaceae bacterium]
MKSLFDTVSVNCSKLVTNAYSTSFSLGIYLLDKKFRDPVYSIYGFVRFADEIVDSFHDFDKELLLEDFRKETYKAIHERISLNPILNSFQVVVCKYSIDKELIDAFLDSMKMDLYRKTHTNTSISAYIYGSAEVVGLMCLKVFCNGNTELYDTLKEPARLLGSAFQKVNFLRDLSEDYSQLGRSYFPGIDPESITTEQKDVIIKEILEEFEEALNGIKQLPAGARLGVYLAFTYYKALFQKIISVQSGRILTERIRIPNEVKIGIMINSYIRYRLNML